MDNVQLDFERMMKAKEDRVLGLTSGIEGLFKKNKVTYVKGRGYVNITQKYIVHIIFEVFFRFADGTI